MFRFLPLLLLAGFVAEIASIIWVGQLVGVLGTILLMALGIIAGLGVFRTTGIGISEALRRSPSDPSAHGALAGISLLRFLAGLFLIVPGFFSDLLAVLLLFPPVQAWLISRLGMVTVQGSSGRHTRHHANIVIEGEAVEIQEKEVPPRPPAKGNGG